MGPFIMSVLGFFFNFFFRPIYNQVIEAGNFEYFSDFTQKISFGDDFFTEIIRKVCFLKKIRKKEKRKEKKQKEKE